MIWKGIRFGMLLQLAVGPMCLLVFRTSAATGLLYGLFLVLAISLVDALYIALSCVGVAAILNRPNIKATVKLLGCCVLILFGISIISDAFGLSFLPEISLFARVSAQNLFAQGLLLTASNPLTILFWSGMFSAQMIEHNWTGRQLFFFAAGCVMATVLFLSAVAFLGSIFHSFLPEIVMQTLNVLVGTALVFFGVMLVWKKEKDRAGS